MSEDTQATLVRRSLPKHRNGWTQKVTIGKHTLYLRVHEYEDGKPGEIFIWLREANPSTRALINSFATSVSIALQYGVPLEVFIEEFKLTHFESSGQVRGSKHILEATSMLDYIFRELEIFYRRSAKPSAPVTEKPLISTDNVVQLRTGKPPRTS